LNVKYLNQKLIETQKNKVFLLWDTKIFHIETIKPYELTCSTIKNIKNNNTIVLNTESKGEIHMLLRWKNHIGVLYPAWQISLKR
jgi:ATP phosphoribosyltransferase regulatory subunit HisZ